jgi:hypothetical protein
MIDVLRGFDAIGWDFDGTLLNHPKSNLMHAFIRAHPAKRHVIVTFRTHGYQNQMFRELRRAYPDAPGPDSFSDVKNISNKAWEEFERYASLRLVNLMDGPLRPWEEYYVEWKGMVCHQLRIPVLIDDLADHVLPGCEKYHIKYLHPDEL